MWRIRSAVPWHILLFLALLLVAAWQAEGLLLQVLVGNRLAQSALVAATAGATGAVAATNDFFSYGLAALQALTSQAFSRLPESVRDALPTGDA